MAILVLGARYPRPFPRAIGDIEFLFVSIDKFTKWLKVTTMRKVTSQPSIKFMKELLCRFGFRVRIITDNGTQFTSHTFMQYVRTLGR